ncbi:MAG TPA: LUD domain-containing protein [Bryobacteraceae bacterium]|nr:LUD domain-containing protein [Bryobacteraceae bacterium]
MSAAKDEILARIRRAVGSRPPGRAAEYQAIPRRYRQAGSLDRAALLDLFEERLRAYGAGVYRALPADLPATIASAAGARGKSRLLVPAGVPAEWLPETLEFAPVESADYAALDASQGALTACSGAIAATGSILLTHGAAEGRRAVTLVPDYHLCVVRAEQIVETVPEAFRRVHAVDASLLTTIAGPSATADIELTRVQGVHGPRTLDVVIVE